MTASAQSMQHCKYMLAKTVYQTHSAAYQQVAGSLAIQMSKNSQAQQQKSNKSHQMFNKGALTGVRTISHDHNGNQLSLLMMILLRQQESQKLYSAGVAWLAAFGCLYALPLWLWAAGFAQATPRGDLWSDLVLLEQHGSAPVCCLAQHEQPLLLEDAAGQVEQMACPRLPCALQLQHVTAVCCHAQMPCVVSADYAEPALCQCVNSQGSVSCASSMHG